MSYEIKQGDVLTVLKTLPERLVHCVVTSPPYWGLRDYGVDGQLGLEKTPEEYVRVMVEVFREVRRVLWDDGTLWLNLDSTYAGGGRGCDTPKQRTNHGTEGMPESIIPPGYKSKDLIPIPWLVALALQRDGWWLRSDIIWHKRSVMPESVTDRPTGNHEYLFLMSKQSNYYYDHAAIAEAAISSTKERKEHARMEHKSAPIERRNGIRPSVARGGFDGKTNALEGREAFRAITEMRNKRTVWTLSPQPFPEAHFATFPEKLVEPCIKAGSPQGGVVLDPFCGSGTTGVVALSLGRNFLGIELNKDYVAMAEKRIGGVMPLFTQ